MFIYNPNIILFIFSIEDAEELLTILNGFFFFTKSYLIGIFLISVIILSDYLLV